MDKPKSAGTQIVTGLYSLYVEYFNVTSFSLLI